MKWTFSNIFRESYIIIYSGLTKTSTALPRLSSKRTIL
ncbi:AzlC family protein [Neisseria meningitidis]|uniref:AzlC family protein n=1 Tax=Neisseria meningitidis TaxID=487 RepID=A0A2A3LUW6_NEIME|nr:AzlC family protein [Neisseria meningitidis]ATL37190.1 AzlC family protein [Neisseria meningitidis]AVH82600.1 AzlC family protein [Neisseria meningitidis]AVH83248.1 AzlC family protein [Neisseria meningitidis]AVI44212.1 AzlC family protein [Neisseria meningitidis]